MNHREVAREAADQNGSSQDPPDPGLDVPERLGHEAHGNTPWVYLYPASGSSDSQVIANVSAGVGFVNVSL